MTKHQCPMARLARFGIGHWELGIQPLATPTLSIHLTKSNTVTTQNFSIPGIDRDVLEAPGKHPFAGWLHLAWQRKWLILLGLVLGLAIGSFQYGRQPPVYASRAQLLVVKKNADA